MSAVRAALILAVLAASARAAWGGPGPPPPQEDPEALVRAIGPAEVRDVHVTVDCAARRVLEVTARCTWRASYEVAATGAVELTAAGGRDVIDLGAPGATRRLAAGEVARIALGGRRALSTSWRLRDPFIVPPMVVRHVFLGDSPKRLRTGARQKLALISGPELMITGAPALAADGDGRVTIDVARDEITVGADGRPPRGPRLAPPDGTDATKLRERRLTVVLALPAPANADGTVHAGGPVLGGGAREDRVLVRAAYEVGLGQWVFVSASFETDFDSILQSVVVDVATPQVLIFLPSLRIGTGVLARQLGPRDPDFGVRLRAGGNLFAMGADLDLDYWPAIDDWTMSGVVRISL